MLTTKQVSILTLLIFELGIDPSSVNLNERGLTLKRAVNLIAIEAEKQTPMRKDIPLHQDVFGFANPQTEMFG